MRVLRILVIAVLVIVGFAQLVRRTSMFYPDRFPIGDWDPSSLPIQPTDETFVTSDNVRLHGWWFPASDPHARVLIWFHGNGGNLTNRAPMAAELARRGVSVFVFDWRGYGKSEGSPSEGRLFRDALGAYDFVAKRSKDLVLYGESLGGPYAAFVAKERGHVHSVILENTFPSLAALGNAMYKPIPIGLTAPFALRTTDWLNDAKVPVLVMHGRRDRTIPFALGQQLYDGLRVPKEMMACENADHCEIPDREGARYYETVMRFANAPPKL